MSIKPILFNTEMVQAILEGRKTQTRRILKNDGIQASPEPCAVLFDGQSLTFSWAPIYCHKDETAKAPCLVGDILWVREAWDKAPESRKNLFHEIYYYRADGDLRPKSWQSNWHPSIRMPKEAARIFLRVKDVRIERLQTITVLDAISEGCSGEACDCINADPAIGCTDCHNSGWLERPETEFALLWDSTIKKDEISEYGWDANPWVFVIEFERCDKPDGWC